MRLAGMESKQERQISVIRVQKPDPPEIESPVSGNDRQECIKEVVAFFDQHGVVSAEDLKTLGDGSAESGMVPVVEDDGERELAKIVAADFYFAQAAAKVGDQARGPLVNQHLLRIERPVTDVVSQ